MTAVDMILKCACGTRATCVGRYEDMTSDAPACDTCCGHGCEDGHCDRAAPYNEDDAGCPGWECSCGAAADSDVPARDAMAHLVTHMGGTP